MGESIYYSSQVKETAKNVFSGYFFYLSNPSASLEIECGLKVISRLILCPLKSFHLPSD